MIEFNSTYKMNTYLKILFEKYNISEKNRYEINQIYILLSDEKKQNLLKNFKFLAKKVNKIEKSISVEKSILIWDAVERIKATILDKREVENDNKIENKNEIISFL